MPDDSSVDIGVNLGIDEPSYKVVIARIKKLQSSIARLNAKPRADFTDKDAQKLKAYNTELEQTIALRDKLAAERLEQVEKSITDGYGVGEFFDVSLPEEAGIGQFFDVTVADDFVQKIEEIPQAQEEVIEKNEELGGGVSSIQDIVDKVVEFGVKKLNQLNGAFGELFEDLAAVKEESAGEGSIFEGLIGAGSILSNIFKGLLQNVKRFFTNIKKNSNSTVTSFKRIGLALLGVRGVFTAVRKATNAYMAQNEETAARLESIWVAIGNAIGPVLEYLIKLITTAFGYINAFVRALTGIDMIANANAKALENQAKATKDATAEQKRQLAAFDEMNKLSDDSGSSSGSGSNAPTLMDFPEFNLNLDDLGEDLAERFNKIFAEIDWDRITEFIRNGMTRVVNEINSFVDKFNFSGLGKTIGNALNEIILAVNIWYKQLDFRGLGQGVIDAITGFFTTVNWSQLFETWVYKKIAGINFITGIIENFDMDALFTTIGDFFKNVDWSGLATNIARAIGSLIGAVFKQLFKLMINVGELISNIWDAITEYFAEYIEKAKEEYPENMFGLAGNIIDGLLMGIIDAMKNIWQWLSDNVFTPFIEGFKDLFGINSPSTVMEKQGEMIVEGLKNGVSGVWDAIKQFFEELPGNIQAFFQNLPQWFSTKFQNIRDAIGEKWENIKQEAADTWQAIKNIFSPVASWFSSTFGKAWAKVKEIFADEDGQFTFKSITDGIKDVFKNIVNSLINGLNNVIAIPFNKINSILNYIKSIEVLGISPFYNLWRWNPVYVPQIPYLAQGAVIPPNKEFMAILGDQKQGTNIEAPLDTIKQALREVQDENQVQPTPVYFNVDGKTFAKAMIKWEKKLEFNFNG